MTDLPIPSGPDALTPEWLADALRSGGVLAEASVTSIGVEPIGEQQAFAGRPVRVRLEYDRAEPGAPSTLVAKFPAEDPAMRRALSGLRWYEAEIRFYDELAAESPVRTPRRYFSAMTPERREYVLLLEEVTSGSVGDQIAGASAARAAAVVEQIARVQAWWWEHPRLEALEWLAVGPVRRAADADFWAQFYRRGWSFVADSMAGILPAEVASIADRLGDAYAAIVRASAEPPSTLIHGDCRLDNVFFPREAADAGGAIDEPLTFIDWQLLSHGRGVYDVAYFLGTNLAPELRRAHEMELLRRYHSIIVEGSPARRVDYSFERCVRDYRLAMLLVFGFWVQTAGAPTFPEAGHPMRDAALSRVSQALIDLDAGELLAGAGR